MKNGIRWFGIVWLSLLAMGCGKHADPVPTTYEVRGRVLKADGSPYINGLIEFRCDSDPTVTTNAIIQPDGSFVLETLAGDKKIPGAIAGMHQVTITPLMTGDQTEQSVAGPIFLRQKYEVTAGLNDLEIRLPK